MKKRSLIFTFSIVFSLLFGFAFPLFAQEGTGKPSNKAVNQKIRKLKYRLLPMKGRQIKKLHFTPIPLAGRCLSQKRERLCMRYQSLLMIITEVWRQEPEYRSVGAIAFARCDTMQDKSTIYIPQPTNPTPDLQQIIAGSCLKRNACWSKSKGNKRRRQVGNKGKLLQRK
ncbi:MAG: hypothetical protein HS127_08885 [Planctomycetia bacterium]|nr:hypothetical protein [Planctomycetia bacterium]